MTGSQPYQSTSALPYGSFKVPGGWIATQGCWGDTAAQTIETTGPNGFRVSKSSHNKPGGVAAYPSVWAGSAWADGSGRDGWKSTKVSDLAGLKTSASITLPSGSWKGNAGAYDIWFDQSASKAAGLELMIWMHTEGVSPAGSKVGSISAGGATWNVWSGTVGGTPVLSYVRSSNTTTLSDLPLKPFMDDAISRGKLGAAWYLTSPQIGAELWVGGAGFALNSWSFAVA